MSTALLETTMHDRIQLFANYLALAYHEARNVRHLVRAGHLEKSRYRMLIDGMSVDRVEAWKQLEPVRRDAARARSAQDAEGIFRRKFGLSLEDLVALSDSPNWRGSGYGSNRWADIDRALVELRSAIDGDDEERVGKLFQELPMMCHNTGRLGEKLKSLERVEPEA
jgi:hypothetical protein